jgi:uncharacterized protein
MLVGMAPSPDRPLELEFEPELALFLPPRDRSAEPGCGGMVHLRADGTSTIGHFVEAAGVPLPEVGSILVNGTLAQPSYQPDSGDRVRVAAVSRPQTVPEPRFLLDVHLGALARRMRLVGLDTVYSNDLDDDTLIELANSGRRVLLTKDRGLLRRRRLWLGAYVRGERADEQLTDVIDRFAPVLQPWTRCIVCNGELRRAPKEEVAAELPPGTKRAYQEFSRCAECGRVYWRGAHSRRLAQIVAAATHRAAAAGSRTRAQRVARVARVAPGRPRSAPGGFTG